MLSRLTLAAVLALAPVSSAIAQEPEPAPAPLEVSVGFGLGKSVGVDCSVSEGGISISLASCSPFEGSVGGSFAVHATDQLAPFFSVGVGFTALNTIALVSGPFIGSTSVPIELRGTGASVGGGVRVYFQPRDERIRGFASIAGGYGRVSSEISVYDFSEDVSAGSPVIVPEVGVDIGLTETVWIRFAGGPTLAFPEDGLSTGVGVGVSFVFRVN